MDIVQPHCCSEAVVGLQRERMGMGHHTHADTSGLCSKVGVNCVTSEEVGVCELWYCAGEAGQDKNLQRADCSMIFLLAFIHELMKIVWLPKRKPIMVTGFLLFLSKVPQLTLYISTKAAESSLTGLILEVCGHRCDGDKQLVLRCSTEVWSSAAHKHAEFEGDSNCGG